MKINSIAGILLVLIHAGTGLKAQEDSSAENNNPELRLGAFYSSRLHFYGRTDSLHSSGFFPLVELAVNPHFYIQAAPVFVMNNATSFEYAGTVATTGLRFYREQKHSAHIYLVKPLYREKSQLVQSALKWQAAATFTWLNKVLNVTGGADMKFSDNTDYGFTAGLDHIFRKPFSGGWILVADPSAYVNAGTQHFTKTSYKNSGFFILPGLQQQVTEQAKKVSILSYEFSIPLVLVKNKFQLLFIPAYVIPQNLITVENRPDLSERGKEMPYFTTGVKWSF